MNLPVEFDLEARAEFDAAADWYEGKKAGLGIQFIEAVNVTIAQIQTTPKLFGMVGPGIRQATVQRFPFSVIYREELSRTLILAVFHGSRDPALWKSRG